VTGVQGTVATWDPESGAGSVLLDDGTPVAFPATAFHASGLRLLRLGQRVRLGYGPDGAVSEVSLITMPAQ
jgi:2-phospho-L-lactate guanylyltransferase